MNDKKNICENNPSVRLSFDDAVENVKTQIEYDCFSFPEVLLVKELVNIIAELQIMQPADVLRVDGGLKTVGSVKDVFKELGHEHIRYVMNNFNSVPYFVKNKKAYMRTALYNSVFELNSSGYNGWGV